MSSDYLSHIHLIPWLGKLRELDRLFPIQELCLCRICERLSVTIVTRFSVENTLPLILATSLYGLFYQYIITWDWQWLRTYIQVTCCLHAEIACVVSQVFLHNFEQVFQLLYWDIWLAIIYHLPEVLCGDIWITFLQYDNCITSCDYEFILKLLEQCLCIYIRYKFTIFIQCSFNVLVTDIIYMLSQLLLQLLYRDVLLIVVEHILELSY